MPQDHDHENALDRALGDIQLGPHPGFSPGATATHVGNPEPTPEATPENMACLRGPCKHYMSMVAFADAGNPAGTPGLLNTVRNHWCLKPKGEPLDLMGETILACSSWDPELPGEEVELRERREQYLESHPEVLQSARRIEEERQIDPSFHLPIVDGETA